jgi:hypothetical protein
MGFLLYIVASVLKNLIGLAAWLYCEIRSLFKKEWNSYNENLAEAKDQYGNALCMYLFNDILIKNNGYKFGNKDETISSVIGKNHIKGTLTWLGRFLDMILDMLQKDHSIKSIDNTIK